MIRSVLLLLCIVQISNAAQILGSFSFVATDAANLRDASVYDRYEIEAGQTIRGEFSYDSNASPIAVPIFVPGSPLDTVSYPTEYIELYSGDRLLAREEELPLSIVIAGSGGSSSGLLTDVFYIGGGSQSELLNFRINSLSGEPDLESELVTTQDLTVLHENLDTRWLFQLALEGESISNFRRGDQEFSLLVVPEPSHFSASMLLVLIHFVRSTSHLRKRHLQFHDGGKLDETYSDS